MCSSSCTKNILWPYGDTITGNITSHQSRLNVHLCHVVTNTCLPRTTREWESQFQQLLKCQNNKQMLPNVLRIFSFPQDRGLIEESDIIMFSYAHEDALSSDDINVLVLPVYLCHDKPPNANSKCRVWIALRLTSMQHVSN